MDNVWTNLLAISGALLAFGAVYLKWSFRYWKSKGLPYSQPYFPFGNDENPTRRTQILALTIKGFYDKMKSQGHKHGGFYLANLPLYIPIDLEYVKNIMAKDFHYFVDRGFYYNEKVDPITAHLFAVGGKQWRKLRTKITPTFTSGKMKKMFPILLTCGQPMVDYVEEYVLDKRPIDIKHIMSSFTADIIGSCAFGLDCNSFKDPNSQFVTIGNKIFKLSIFQEAKSIFSSNFPNVAKFLGFTNIPTHLTKFYYDIVRDTVEFREKNNYTRKDFMQLLLELKNGESDNLTLDEVAAQSFIFFLAGYETSSTTLAFCYMELAKHTEIQEKVRKEIIEVLRKHEGKITYDSIMEMKYLTQVVQETLRKYPPLSSVTRLSTKDYKIPGTDVVLDNNTMVLIPIYSIQHDPEYFPNPEIFDPERFSYANKDKLHQYSYLPFGEGPRICIGLRFGMMQVKIGVTLLLQKYKVFLNKSTQYPIELDPYSFMLCSKSTIYLDVEKL